MSGPPVVLVHGLGSSAEHGWRAAGWIDLLGEAGREVIAVDLPGHGAGRRLPDGAGHFDVAAELAAVFAARGPVDAIGFSAGARLLLECAVRGLGDFSRLALLGIGPAALGPPSPGLAALADALAAGDDGDPRARLLLRMLRRAGNDPVAVSVFLRHGWHEITAAQLAAAACTALVVTGEHDPAGSAVELAAMLPRATGVVIPGADHYAVPGDARTMDAVLRFLGL